MAQEKEYFAFISYQRQDEDWAKWLADQLEHYHLPLTLNGRDDLPKDLRPIFRDIDELAAGNLPQQIHQALQYSKNLIVVCSPNSAKSPWVNKEVETFIGMGKLDNIFPFIIDGVPFSKNKDEECLPEALRKLSDDKERLGANVREYKDRPQRLCKDCPLPKNDRDNKKQGNINDKGRDAAVVKIVAGMLGIGFDTLWQRYEKEKAEEERKIREQRYNLLRFQSRFISEKVHQMTEEDNPYMAAILASYVLPTNLEEPDYPYITEAEKALRGAQNHQEQILMHHSALWYATLSPKEPLIASACEDGTIWLWDRKTGKLLKILKGHTERIQQVAFTPDGKKLASASHDGTARLWDIQSGECLSVFERHKGKVFSVAFSPDGKILATGSEDTSIKLWDTNLNCCIKTLFGHNHNVLSITFTTDGKSIISSSADQTIRIWRQNKGLFKKKEWVCEKILKGHNSGIWSARLNPEETHIVSASLDNTIRIWDAKSGKCLKVLNEKEQINPNTRSLEDIKSGVQFASFSPDGNSIVSAFIDNTIRIWNCETGECHVISDKYNGFATSVLYSSDGNEIISADTKGKVHIHRDVKKALRYKLPSLPEISHAYFLKNNQTIISESWQTLRIWDVTTGKCTHVFEKSHFLEQSDGNFLIWSRDILPNYQIIGNKICDNSPYYFPEKKSLIPVLKIGANQLIEDDYENFNAVGTLPYMYDINLYDISSEKIVKTFHGHTDRITDAIFCPDAKTIITSSADKTVRMWDLWTGKCLHRFEGHNYEVCQIALSSDGTIMASLDYHNICVWNMKTRECIRTLTDKELHYIYVSLSLDGKWMAIAKEHSILVWSVTAGEYVLDIIYPSEKVYTVEFSPDGRRIVASFEKGIIRILDFPPLQELINEVHEQFKNRPLTPEERRKYYLD